MRSDIPTGSWSLNMSCGSVDIWRNFTPFMSWWITEISQTISDKTPPCPTGRQQQDGGTVASSSLVLTRRKRNYSSSPFPHLQGCIMCTPPGLAPLYWRPWWQCFLGSTSYCWTVIVYLLLCLKLKTCGLRPTWRVFQPIVRVAFLRHTPLRALARFCKDPQVVYTQSRVCSTRMGQGALVVTEPHAELNAGLIVIFRSSHPPLFDWNAWSLRLRSSPGSITEDEFKDEASNLAFAFWDRIGEFLKRSRTGSELSPDEKTLWIQSGLALSPLMGTCLQYSLDFCLAWALIGEWTSRVLFPVPKGPWPRHGHAGAVLQNYQSFWCTTRVIWRSSTTETKWSMPLPTRSGCQAQVEQSSRAASRPVLVWRLSSYYLLRLGWVSSVGGEGKASINSQHKNKLPKKKRPMRGLHRAQQICFIMGPLDMRGLVGAATIIGCLKYGASFSGLDDQDDPVFLIRLKDEDLLSPDDSAFLQSLRFSCARVNGVYPPLALVEAYITEEDSAPRVRRLHLMVVDLHRRRRMADRVLRLLVDLQVDRCAEECLHTLPIPWKRNQEAYQLRYVFGYAMEGSDLPCYILWPTRTAEQSFWCIDAWKGDWVRLDKCVYMAPLGIEHFFDAFCFDPQRPWGTAAIQALGIPSCRVSKDAYLENMHVNTFLLTPRRIPVERKASAAKREVDQDMVAREESVSEVGSDAESGWSGVSDNSSTDSECTDIEASSIASDQDRFDTAYEAFRGLANDLYYIDLRRYSRGITSEDAAGVLLLDGHEKLQELVHLPRTWPLARPTIPLEGLSKQIDRLLEGYCFQILATNRYPEAHNGRVLQTATHLTWILAEYLADTIAWLMRSILGHDSKILFDKDTQLLLTPKFWLLPLYREFLNSARRIRPSPASERARGCTGLVKVICKENKEQKGKRKYHAGTPHPNDRGGFPQWFGSCSLMRFMSGFQPAGRRWLLRGFLVGLRESTYTQEGRPASGPPHRHLPEHILGTKIVRALLDPVSQWRILTALKWSTRSGNGHCQVLQWCQCSMWAVESSGWNWMIKLYWIAMGCYRRAFSVTCFRRNVLLLGRWTAYSERHVARPPRCGWLAQLHVIAEELVAYLHNAEYSHRGNLSTGIQQRTAKAAGPAFVDGGQSKVGGASWPNVRQSTHWEIQRRFRCSALWQGRQTQPHRPLRWEEVSWGWNQRGPKMVEDMSRLDGTL